MREGVSAALVDDVGARAVITPLSLHLTSGAFLLRRVKATVR